MGFIYRTCQDGQTYIEASLRRIFGAKRDKGTGGFKKNYMINIQ
jgi:hypothetical protein